MKKIIEFFVLMMLIVTFVPAANSFERDFKENNYEIQNDINSFILEDCECESDNGYNTMTLGILKYYKTSYQKGFSSKPSITVDLPDYFSWKDFEGKDWTTPAKDQGNCGSCWDFAAIGVLESIISIRENCSGLDPDLSEQYILSCLPGAGSCSGGLARAAYFRINITDVRGKYCNGVVLESCMQYQADDDVECSDKCDDWEEKLIPIIDYGYWYPDGSENDIESIKSQIMEHGPVVATMFFTYYVHGKNNLEEWGWTHSSPNDYYPYPGPVDNANHQVVLVGWKNDPDIGNGGYWIVKNSCSSEWGYNGFFNIEYGSLNIDSIEIDWVEYDPDLYNNWAPKVYSGGIYIGTVGVEINFDGTSTVDPEDDIVEYIWDFGDGTQKNGITQSHTYDNEGIYPLILTVTDNNGNIGIDESWVFIDRTNSQPNNPVLKGRKIGQSGKEYEYTFYADDPDGDDVYYYLNWGDVYWDGSWQPWIGPYKSGETVTLSNIWDTIGEYVIRVKAKDKYDAESRWSILNVEIPKKKSIDEYDIWIIRLIQRFPILQYII